MAKIERRTLLKTLGGVSLGGFIPISGKAFNETRKPVKDLKIIETEILVIGGGTAGVIAAIQAGRAGCSTVLVENGSQLGGTITTAGVAFPGLFHAWGKQVISGIGWELVTETVRLDDGKLPDFLIPTGRQHYNHQIRLNPFLYACLAEEKCLEAGVQLRYYETPVKAEFNDNHWEVETIGKGTHVKIVCNQLIDCTGNASVTSLAGFRVLRENETQPGTQIFQIDGYDINSVDLPALQKSFEEEVKKGNLLYADARGNIAGILRTKGDNSQHVLKADSSTSESHTQTNIQGRASVLRLLRFLRKFPGCENTKLVRLQPETGVRETYRIDGEYQVTREDYVTGKVFEDSLAYSFYPIDLHDSKGIVPKHLDEGVVATIPLRALIPKGSKNFLVAGRCISSDRMANSALRVQASCMAMGQAAASTAVLAFKNKTIPLSVPVKDIAILLLDHGAIVPA
jgi:glycine/D-amino acid oxidase-like deaminating enzyme